MFLILFGLIPAVIGYVSGLNLAWYIEVPLYLFSFTAYFRSTDFERSELFGLFYIAAAIAFLFGAVVGNVVDIVFNWDKFDFNTPSLVIFKSIGGLFLP